MAERGLNAWLSWQTLNLTLILEFMPQGMAAQMLQVHQELQQRMCAPWESGYSAAPGTGCLSSLLQLWDYESSLSSHVRLHAL